MPRRREVDLTNEAGNGGRSLRGAFVGTIRLAMSKRWRDARRPFYFAMFAYLLVAGAVFFVSPYLPRHVGAGAAQGVG